MKFITIVFILFSISLGVGFNALINKAIADTASLSNVIVVVAAGNQADNACKRSPASSKYAITVGSTLHSLDDGIQLINRHSNYGSCVDIFAPGEYFTNSGTSFSAPRITGVLALAASLGCISNVQQAKQLLPFISTKNVERKYFNTTNKSILRLFTNHFFEAQLKEEEKEKESDFVELKSVSEKTKTTPKSPIKSKLSIKKTIKKHTKPASLNKSTIKEILKSTD